MFKQLTHLLNLLWNSIHYITYRKPLVVSAYVEIKDGKMVRRNWGDDINVFLLERLSGRKVVVKNQSLLHKIMRVPSYLCIGSTIGFMMDENTTVWGAGAMYPYNSFPCKPKSVAAVRGPLTRKALVDSGIDCPDVYGDPALLISKYYHPVYSRKYRVGIVTHYTDEDCQVLHSWVSKHQDVLLISMSKYQRWEEIPDKICSCEVIWSSSLHGIIVSDAYSIPNQWVRFGNDVAGGAFKYKDYFCSVGRNEVTLYPLHTEDQFDELYSLPIIKDSLDIDLSRLQNSCPFLQISE